MSGRIAVVALAREYHFTDIDGTAPDLWSRM